MTAVLIVTQIFALWTIIRLVLLLLLLVQLKSATATVFLLKYQNFHRQGLFTNFSTIFTRLASAVCADFNHF